jgi:protein-disulfide isomerase/uncharacterized membrane protein
MMSRIPLLLLRIALLLAIGVSVALLIDYLRPLPAFCDIGSGCERVKVSPYAHIFGLPLPIFGVLGFVALMVLSWSSEPWARRLTRVLAIAAGVAGIALLSIQGLVLHVFCKLCMAVDIAAIVAGLSAAFAGSSDDDARAAQPWFWPATTIVALAVPGAWALFQPSPPVPPEIASLWVPDKINVVEFADFQCPFCRKLHPAMTQLLGEYADRVHFVRLNMPLSMHPDARTAARAYCCAENQGHGQAMADALFSAESLSSESCEKIAKSVGVPIDAYRSCVHDAATDAHIDDQMRQVRAAGLAGLPTVWIGSEVIVGLQSEDTLSAAFAKAASNKHATRLPTTVLWGIFAVGLAAVACVALRRPPRSAS